MKELEAGNVEASKRDIAFGVATVCRYFKRLEEPSQWVKTQKRDIEIYAKKRDVGMDANYAHRRKFVCRTTV